MMDEPELYVQKILESFGLPFSAARVYARLVLSRRPMTIEELAAETGLGKSTVSTALRLLEHDGMVYYEKRGRKKIYYARSSFYQLLLFPVRVLREYVSPLRRALERKVAEGRDDLAPLLEEVRVFEKVSREIEEIVTRELRSRGPGGGETGSTG